MFLVINLAFKVKHAVVSTKLCTCRLPIYDNITTLITDNTYLSWKLLMLPFVIIMYQLSPDSTTRLGSCHHLPVTFWQLHIGPARWSHRTSHFIIVSRMNGALFCRLVKLERTSLHTEQWWGGGYCGLIVQVIGALTERVTCCLAPHFRLR